MYICLVKEGRDRESDGVIDGGSCEYECALVLFQQAVKEKIIIIRSTSAKQQTFST